MSAGYPVKARALTRMHSDYLMPADMRLPSPEYPCGQLVTPRPAALRVLGRHSNVYRYHGETVRYLLLKLPMP
jgi:hypothetical protein